MCELSEQRGRRARLPWHLVASPRGRSAAILLASAVAVFGVAAGLAHSRPREATHDLSGWLQRRLDRHGGFIFLPRLGGGRCYQTRGLWVSRSGTTIASDGACLTVTGPGVVRLRSADGDPIGASAAFFVSRSSPSARSPEHVTIRGLRIHVPPGSLDGIDVYGRHVRIANVRIDGAPFDDVYIGGRTDLIDYSRDVNLTGSTLFDAERNVISVTAAENVRISHNTIAGAGLSVGTAADPGDGIDVEPNAPTDPIVGLRIEHNKIVGNVHEGIALRLHPHGGLSVHANGIGIIGNEILGNYPWGGGAQIALSGGQANQPGRVLIAGNRFAFGDNSSLSLARSSPEHVVARDNIEFHPR